MKSKTIFYLCLLLILVGSLIVGSNAFMGILIVGIFSYLAGGYQLKYRLEENDNEYDKLLGGNNEKKKS